MTRSSNTKGVLLVAVSAAAFGLIPIFARQAYASGASTYTLLFLRFLAGAAFMFTLMTVRRLPMPSGREIIAYLLLGGLGYAGQSFCYFTALNYTTAGTLELLLYIYPALVMLGSALFLKEKITPIKLLSLALTLAGAFIIVGGEFRASLTGILLSIGCGVIYAIYILASSVAVKEGRGIQSSAFIMLGAAVSFGLLTLVTGFVPPKGVSGWMGLVFLVLICTVIALWSFFTGMESTGPAAASLVSALEPVVTVVTSALFLNEPMTATMVLGGCLVIAALVLTTLWGRKKE